MKIKEFLASLAKWDKTTKQTFILDLALGESLSPETIASLKEYWNPNFTLEIRYGDNLHFKFTGNLGEVYEYEHGYAYNVWNHFRRLEVVVNHILFFIYHKLAVDLEQKVVLPFSVNSDSLTEDQVHRQIITLIVQGDSQTLDKFIEKHYAKINFRGFSLGSQLFSQYSDIAQALYLSNHDPKYTAVKDMLGKWEYVYTQPEQKLQNESQLMMECLDEAFPRPVVWSRDLTLHYSAKLVSSPTGTTRQPKRPPCEIPDPVDPETGLTLHEKMFLTEALFKRLRDGKPVSLHDAYLPHSVIDERVKESKKITHVKQIEHYPSAQELDSTTYLVANIGFIFSKKYQHATDSFGKFVTFPIEDAEYSLITQAQVDSSGVNPHAEVNFYAYFRTESFKKWLVEKLKSYASEHKSDHLETITCYGVILDTHSSNTMCDKENCQSLSLKEQSPNISGNAYSIVKDCLLLANYEIPRHGYLRMVTRVSSHQGDSWASVRAHGVFRDFEYQEFNKDMRHAITKELKTMSQSPAPTKTDAKEISDINNNPYLFHRLRGNGVVVHQPTMNFFSVVQKIKPTCHVLTLTHTTFFRNRCFTDRCLKTDFRMPTQLPINPPEASPLDAKDESGRSVTSSTLQTHNRMTV